MTASNGIHLNGANGCEPEPCIGMPLPPRPGKPDDLPETPHIASLYEMVVRRVRWANTIFGQNVKLVMRQLDDEQWSLLTPPYVLVVPTVARPQARLVDQEQETIVNPRSVTFIAQLDARGSEAEWMAAADIEVAEKQLIGCLVNWRPQRHYLPTLYAGMRVQASRAPDVKVSFVFVFNEQLVVLDDSLVGLEDAEVVVLNRIDVRVGPNCCEEQPAGLPVPPICVIKGGCP
jgi:hypothetical protein